ncbi:MAG: SDR family oxidoreductase [Prevotella sp.]|jgi:3-oxoacyl-[acyl-carrier protein] reductase|nr:SDR family oxidoreductase [Prevotella sp.]
MVMVITGSRKGIGRYLAEYYLAKGNTVIGCSREESDLKRIGYYHFQADVSNEKSVNEFCGKIRKEFQSVDVLINNAGAASMNHFMFTPATTAKRLMELNYIGAYHSVRALINLLKKSENPRIINFTTVAVPLVLAGEIAYIASKSAVEAFTRVLAKELAPFKITVNAIGPTPIDTDLTAHVSKEKLESLMAQQAIHRMGTFSDISNVIDFFISPESNFVTGQILYLGGVN